MALWLKALADHAEDLGLAPQHHKVVLGGGSETSAAGDLTPSSGIHEYQTHMWYAYLDADKALGCLKCRSLYFKIYFLTSERGPLKAHMGF